MMLHKTVPMFSHAKEDDFAPGAPLAGNSNVPETGYPLLRLWRDFGLRAHLSYLQWRELRPVLQRLPDVFKLAHPHVDQGTAERVIHGYFRRISTDWQWNTGCSGFCARGACENAGCNGS